MEVPTTIMVSRRIAVVAATSPSRIDRATGSRRVATVIVSSNLLILGAATNLRIEEAIIKGVLINSSTMELAVLVNRGITSKIIKASRLVGKAITLSNKEAIMEVVTISKGVLTMIVVIFRASKTTLDHIKVHRENRIYLDTRDITGYRKGVVRVSTTRPITPPPMAKETSITEVIRVKSIRAKATTIKTRVTKRRAKEVVIKNQIGIIQGEIKVIKTAVITRIDKHKAMVVQSSCRTIDRKPLIVFKNI